MLTTKRVTGWFAFSIALGLMAPLTAQALPSFPGAEGFGAVATGGRGGKVIKVTTLASSGPGSLAAALATPGPRIIVFAVSGVIVGDQTVLYGDVTLAGQTAPGAGITLAGRLFGDYDSAVGNIIVRHVRVRPKYDGSAGNQFDAVQFSLNKKVMLDHLSVSWGVDENIDLYEAEDVTVQHSTIEESATSGHPEGVHNYGLINGPDGARAAIHHNLFAHHKNRCPALANGPAEVRNNVVYNVRHGFVHHNPASGHFNIVGNTYIQGPNDNLYPFYFDDENGGTSGTLKYFLADNAIDDPGDLVGVVENPWLSPPAHPTFADLFMDASYRTATEFDFTKEVAGYQAIETHSSQAARALVLAQAGAFPRDAVTKRIVGEVMSRTGAWGVHAPSNLLEGLTPASPPADSDGDGMADAWESMRGLDATNGADHTKAMPSGYTAIEEYINGLADALIGVEPEPTTSSSGSGSGSSSSSGATTTTSGAGGGVTTTTTTSGAGGAGGDPSTTGATTTGMSGSGGGDAATSGSSSSSGATSGVTTSGGDDATSSVGESGGCSLDPAPSRRAGLVPLALAALGLFSTRRARRR